MSAEVMALREPDVAILGQAPAWIVAAALGPQFHPQMRNLTTVWPTLNEAQRAAERLAVMLRTDSIRFIPQSGRDRGGASAVGILGSAGDYRIHVVRAGEEPEPTPYATFPDFPSVRAAALQLAREMHCMVMDLSDSGSPALIYPSGDEW